MGEQRGSEVGWQGFRGAVLVPGRKQHSTLLALGGEDGGGGDAVKVLEALQLLMRVGKVGLGWRP